MTDIPIKMQKNNSANTKYKQFKHEHETWQRMLDYFQYENNQMKNRLAEILKSDVDTVFLEKLEQFQTRFLNKDAIILLLLRDIVKQAEASEINKDDEAYLSKTQNKLRDEMQKIEREFNLLKYDFHNYLSKTL